MSSDVDWSSLKEAKPKPGQRCVVWDKDLDQPVFAYFERRGFFFRPNIGDTRVIDADFWMPQPTLNDGHSDD